MHVGRSNVSISCDEGVDRLNPKSKFQWLHGMFRCTLNVCACGLPTTQQVAPVQVEK